MTKEQRQWCTNASMWGGSFVKSFAYAMCYADDQNEKLLLPVLAQLMEKYPHYSDDRFSVEHIESLEKREAPQTESTVFDV